MTKFQNKWKEMLFREKICMVLQWIFSLSAITCLVLEILGVCNVLTLEIVTYPVMKIGYMFLACSNICRSVVTWRESKVFAISSIVTSVFLFVVAAISIYLSAMSG